jgi:hypothetical protein
MFVSYKTVHDSARPRQWHSLARQALAAGMVMRQNGDAEGCLSFDPSNARQARLAIRISGAKVKRQLSDAQKAAKAAILADARTKLAAQALSGEAL